MIIGDVIVDAYIWGDVNRISPEAPVPVFEIEAEKTGCGGAANVAQNVASLGGDAVSGRCRRKRQGRRKVSPDANRNEPCHHWDLYRCSATNKHKTRVIARADTTAFAGRERDSGHHLLRIDRESKQKSL